MLLFHLNFFLLIHATNSQHIEVTILKVEFLQFSTEIKTNDIFRERNLLNIGKGKSTQTHTPPPPRGGWFLHIAISHIFFANNLILFAKANLKNCRTIKYVFDNFCSAWAESEQCLVSCIFLS